MPICDRFRVEVYLPAPVAERRAHGLETCTCSIVVKGPASKNESMLDVLLDGSSGGGHLTAVIVLGDFGREIARSTTGMHDSGFELAGHRVYWTSSRADVSDILDSDIESLAIFRSSAENLQRAALDNSSRPASWWALAERTPIGILSAISRIGPVVFYAAAESSFELMGSEQEVLDTLRRIRSFAAETNA